MSIASLLAILVATGCFWRGFGNTGRERMRKIFFCVLSGSLFLAFILLLWCVLFYALMRIPLSEARPWGMIPFILESADLGNHARLALWGIPGAFSLLLAAHFTLPLLEPSWRHLYGDAHFARRSEIRKMGLLNESGNIVAGALGSQLLHYSLTNHMLIFAPSRSGKGVSLVIPNALNWKGSLLATDNKYEIWQYTSGYRSTSGNAVYRFSPANKDCKTHRINPLDYVNRKDPCKSITDIHMILDILIKSTDGENEMWVEEARSIALGLLLWLMQSDRPFSLGELSAMVKGGDLDVFLEQVIEESIIADNLISIPHAAFLAIQNYLQKAPKEQSGVRSTLTSMLRLWEDPLICAATHCSDMDFRQMRKKPITVYLSFGTAQIPRLAPLINLVIQLFLNVMLDSLPGEDEPCKVLCLLDEMNRFGRMERLKDGFGDLAGYGVHLMPVIQNVGQFHATYGGRDNTDIFFQNTDLKIGFRQNTETDREFISKSLGNKTVQIRNRSYGSDRTGSNYSESLVERPLLSPAEVGSFPMNKQILITGDGIVRCHKIVYYKNRHFREKLLSPIPVPTVIPQFPIIEVRKNIPVSQDSEPDSPRKETQAHLIGKAIAETLSPLIKNLSDNREKSDRHTDEMLNSLARAFEEEGV